MNLKRRPLSRQPGGINSGLFGNLPEGLEDTGIRQVVKRNAIERYKVMATLMAWRCGGMRRLDYAQVLIVVPYEG